mmetsp:Transcript_4210/g.9099  ORF Transcript_4210/g.9099 Transcript_4210/m.9099 type:complete len:80 (+) Transcript_4210:397-636(+)
MFIGKDDDDDDDDDCKDEDDCNEIASTSVLLLTDIDTATAVQKTPIQAGAEHAAAAFADATLCHILLLCCIACYAVIVS